VGSRRRLRRAAAWRGSGGGHAGRGADRRADRHARGWGGAPSDKTVAVAGLTAALAGVRRRRAGASEAVQEERRPAPPDGSRGGGVRAGGVGAGGVRDDVPTGVVVEAVSSVTAL